MAPSYIAFYKELAQRYKEVGSFCPSSPDLSRLMVEPLRELPGARRVLEVGPGTGPITREILKLLNPNDSFTICEINSNLLKRLRSSLETNRFFLKHRSRVSFYEGPVQQLHQDYPDTKYDVIICSLPFSNFQPEVTEEIMSSFYEMLDCGGRLSFFEYWGMRKIGRLLSPPKQRERLKAIDNVINKWRSAANEQGSVRTKVSLLNLPPAKTIQFNFYS